MNSLVLWPLLEPSPRGEPGLVGVRFWVVRFRAHLGEDGRLGVFAANKTAPFL